MSLSLPTKPRNGKDDDSDDDDDDDDLASALQSSSQGGGQSTVADDESSSWSGYTPSDFSNGRPWRPREQGSTDDMSSEAPESLVVEGEKSDELGSLEATLTTLGVMIIEDNKKQRRPPTPTTSLSLLNVGAEGGGSGESGGDTDGGGGEGEKLALSTDAAVALGLLVVDRSRGNSTDGDLTVAASHAGKEGGHGYATGETATERLSRASSAHTSSARGSARDSPLASSRMTSSRSATSDLMRNALSKLGSATSLAKKGRGGNSSGGAAAEVAVQASAANWDPSEASVENEPRKRVHEMTYDQITAYTKGWSKKRLGEDLDTLHSLHVSTTQRGAQDCKIIGRRLRMTPSLSSSLGRRHVNMLAKRFILYLYRDKERIFDQGDVGDMFYIVFDGQVEITVDDAVVAKLSNFESFGDTALRTQQPRSGSAVAEGDVVLMGLTAFNFQMILQKFNRERDEKCATFLQTHCVFLKSWPDYRIRTLIHQSHHQEYKKGTRIWYQDDDAETVAILLDGDVALEREVNRRLTNRWPVRLNSPSRRRRPVSRGGTGAATGGRGGSDWSPSDGRPLLLLSGSDGGGGYEAMSTESPPRSLSCQSQQQLSHPPLALPVGAEKALLSTATTNEPNTPRGIHHEEVRERVERHRQRLVAPGELLGEEILGGSMRRPCTAVVLSSRATILVLNAKEAKQFFKNDLVKIAKFNAKFIASNEDIYAKLRAHQIKECLRQGSCGDKYLKRKNAQPPSGLPRLTDGKERRPWTTASNGGRSRKW